MTPPYQKMTQRSAAGDIDWDDIRVFVAVAEHESFRAAAKETGLTVLTVRRRVKSLEKGVGALLFHRSSTGVKLTEDGAAVLETGLEMLRPARRLLSAGRKRNAGLRSTVKIGITEGLGTFWLIPRVIELNNSHPEIQTDIRCAMVEPDISALEADIAVTLDRPAASDLKIARLGWLHIAIFASRSYIEKYGGIARVADVSSHRLIEIVAPQIQSHRVDKVVDEDRRRFVSLRVNTSSSQMLAVTHGAGVTALPTYAPLITHELVHVAPDYIFSRDIWLAYHPLAGELAHVRKAIAWIRSCFDPVRFPWFAKKYMSPTEITALANAEGIERLFASFREHAPTPGGELAERTKR